MSSDDELSSSEISLKHIMNDTQVTENIFCFQIIFLRFGYREMLNKTYYQK